MEELGMEMVEQRSPEWFMQRRGRVTGSNVGAILGLDPWRTRADVMRAMVRDALDAESEFDGNPATRWGQANEENARMDFELETGHIVKPAPFVPYEDWAGASPDGFIGDDAVAEIKCPYGIRKDENPVFKSLHEQPHYYAQVQFELLCTGRTRCFFYQWTPNGTRTAIVTADQEWRDENLPKLRQFYAEFLHEVEHNSEEHLKPRRVTLDSPEAHRMVREYDELAEQAAWIDERKKELLAQMVEIAGEKNTDFAGRKLTKVERAGSISYAKLVKDHCPNVDKTPYIGAPTSYWKLT
jgi:putative phage-type endonuclease